MTPGSFISATGAEQTNSFSKVKTALILALIIFAIGVNVVAPILATQWANTPFVGSLFEHTLVVSDVYNPNWSGRLAGLSNPEILKSIDDMTVANSQQLAAIMNTHLPGDEVTLTLYRVGEPEFEATVVVSRFSGTDLAVIFGIPYIVGLIYLALGLFVYRLRASERAGEVFVVFCAFFSISTGSFFEIYSNHYLTPVWTFILPFVAASLIHLALVFPVETKLIKRYPWLRFAPYVPAAVLALNGLFSLYVPNNPTGYFNAWALEFGFLSFGIAFFFIMLFVTWYINFSPLVRQQTWIIFWGSLIAFTPVFVWHSAAVLNIRIPFSGPVYVLIFTPLILFPVSIAYAILRYQLLELDTIFSVTLLYATLTTIIVLVFLALAAILHFVFNIPSPFSSPTVLLVYMLGLIVFLGPLRDWLQKQLNRLLSGSDENYQTVSQDYGHRLAGLPLDVDGILKVYLQQVHDSLETSKLMVFFIDTRTSSFDIRATFNQQQKNSQLQISYLATDSLPDWLSLKREVVRLNPDGKSVSKILVDQEELARLAMLSVRLVVPLFGTEQLLGWLALGDKESGAPYHQADINFLSSISNQTVIALENAQLFEMANRKTQELMALQQTNLDIASEQNAEHILTSVVQRATNLLKAKGGSIYLLDVDYGQLNNEICFNLDPDYASISLGVGQGIAGQVIRDGEARLIADYKTVQSQVNVYPGDDFGPVIAVPFAWKGQVRGVLELIRNLGASPFSQEDVDLLMILANQAAIALENTRLLREAESKAAQLATLNEVNRVISATLKRDEALELVMRKAVEILNTEAGSIFLVDESGQNLTFEVALGPTGVTLVGAKIPINDKSIAGTIALQEKGVIVNNVAKDPHWNTSFDEASEFRTRDILGVPMVAFSRVIGVIEVINKTNYRGFTDEDLQSLSIFAGQAAISIVNAERFSQTDQALASRVSELTTLELIDRELNASLDFEAVLKLTLAGLIDFLGASVGLIALLNPDKTGLVFESFVGGVAREYRQYRDSLWPLDKGNIGKVALEGKPMLIGDNGSRDCFAGQDRPSISQLCLPLIAKDEVLGVISVEKMVGQPFTQDDFEFAKRLATHASLAIQNARLFEEVKAANLAKTEFMSVASHELKVPMTSIKGYARMLEMMGADNFSDQQKGFLKIITSNIDRMNRLVNDLLDVSRIEAGRIRLEMEDVAIKDVVDEVVQSVETQIKTKNLKLVTNIPASIPVIWADYGRLVQIMTNLVSNAYKYTPAGGQVEIIVEHQNGGVGEEQVRISIKDNGFGISEEDQRQLFSKFFRASDQNIRDVPGTGLGLSITKSMVEMHGGAMWFTSTLGEGSTFGFDLPVKRPLPQPEEVEVERAGTVTE